jgi:hypothetical protein
MKHRGIYVATGASIGMVYLAAGVALLRWVEQGGAPVWSEGEAPPSVGRILLVQSYLPLAVAAIGLASMAAPFLFLTIWLSHALLIAPARSFRAAYLRRQTRRAIKKADRCISWHALEPLLAQGAGVLILDATLCRPGLVWWTADDLLRDDGLLVMSDDRFAHISHDQLDRRVERLLPQSRFRARYLDTVTGQALLTPLPAAFLETKKFRRAYPHMLVFAIDVQQGRIRVARPIMRP